MSALLAGLTFDARTGLLQGRGHALHLPAGQARLFAVLWRAASADPGLYLSGTAIAERLGGAPRDLHAPAIRLRAKLKPFGLALDSRMGAGGGYRLAAASSSEVRDAAASKHDVAEKDVARPAMREATSSRTKPLDDASEAMREAPHPDPLPASTSAVADVDLKKSGERERSAPSPLPVSGEREKSGG